MILHGGGDDTARKNVFGRFCPSGPQQLAVLADAVEGGGAEVVDVVVVAVHGEGREVADAALPVGRDFIAGFRGIPGNAGKGLPPF